MYRTILWNPSTSSIAGRVLVEIVFPNYLRGKPKLNIRWASGGMYTKFGSYAPTQFHLVDSKKNRMNHREISYVDVLYVHYTCTKESHLSQYCTCTLIMLPPCCWPAFLFKYSKCWKFSIRNSVPYFILILPLWFYVLH